MKKKFKARNWIFIFSAVLIFVLLFALQFIRTEREIVKTRDLTCVQDSDCVVKSNGLNCPEVFRVDDLSEPQLMIPPSHTTCPDKEDLLAYCSEGVCAFKMDCSHCDSLRVKWEYCNNYSGGTSSWLCGMYNACGCSENVNINPSKNIINCDEIKKQAELCYQDKPERPMPPQVCWVSPSEVSVDCNSLEDTNHYRGYNQCNSGDRLRILYVFSDVTFQCWNAQSLPIT